MRLSLSTGLLAVAGAAALSGCTAAGPLSSSAPRSSPPLPSSPLSSSLPSSSLPSSPLSSSPLPARTGCGSPVETGPLPEWARAGFSGDSSMPHVMGGHGDIVAAVFGYPLTVARTDGAANKILWVSKAPAPPGDLVIEAKLDGPGVAATRRVPGGPGPSIIDLPQAGCWRLTLTWTGHTDTMDLVYR